MKRFRIVSLALLMVGFAACDSLKDLTELEVPNENNPDRERVTATAKDVESVIGSAMLIWWEGVEYSSPSWALSTAADEGTMSWGNFGMQQLSSEPRVQWPNDPAFTYRGTTETPWYGCYGALSSALEVGALATSLVLIARPPIRHAGRALLVAVAVYGLATIVFGLSRSFPLSLAAYMLVGVADQVSVVMRSTIWQLSTHDELRGRVSAINMMFINASNQLGAAESGFVAALTSAPFAAVSGGVMSIVVHTNALMQIIARMHGCDPGLKDDVIVSGPGVPRITATMPPLHPMRNVALDIVSVSAASEVTHIRYFGCARHMLALVRTLCWPTPG